MRLLVHVEGETEESFVNELLAAHLCGHGFARVGARLLGNSRQRSRRGGIRAWESVRSDIIAHLRQDPGCIATTMVDYYALPRSGTGAWPGRMAASSLTLDDRAACVEAEIHRDLCQTYGPNLDPNRFVPFVLMHEFEALLFSDCGRFAAGMAQPGLADPLRCIRTAFESPEHINDSPQTAPSKRIEALFPPYQKPLHGTLAALEIGLETMVRECPHFGGWLARLRHTLSHFTPRP